MRDGEGNVRVDEGKEGEECNTSSEEVDKKGEECHAIGLEGNAITA